MISFDELKDRPQYPLGGVSAAAAIAFSVLASRTLKPRTILEDLRLRSRLAIPFGYLGKEIAVAPLAALTGAGLLARDRKAAAATVKTAAVTASVLAISLGFDRLVQDRHWTSDVVAGWLAAISIAGLAAAGYESARPRRIKRRARASRQRENR
jgi:membrane-associated phospholipid phosphatase